jgi:predicted trehalose synthase
VPKRTHPGARTSTGRRPSWIQFAVTLSTKALSMDPEREAWIRRVAAAAGSAAEHLRKLDDPFARELLSDLDALQQRLVAELHADEVGG